MTAAAADIEAGGSTHRHGALAALGLCVILLAGCSGGASSPSTSVDLTRTALDSYLTQIEPLRLGVNRLLDGADPILAALRERRVPAAKAAAAMGALERRFALFTVKVAAIRPQTPSLRALHAEYAQTYVLEDSYLSALTTGLAQRELADLPRTQAAQRAAIIRWRTGLTVLAQEVHLTLPADLQRAGRGEIAPSPQGS